MSASLLTCLLLRAVARNQETAVNINPLQLQSIGARLKSRVVPDYDDKSNIWAHWVHSSFPVVANMDDTRYPIVTPLPPSSSLNTDHHGPSGRQKAALPDDRPNYFQNPWRSYRAASISDAWLAYQRGAAIAPDQAKLAGPSRRPKRASSTSLDDDELENEPLVQAKSRVYVRPEFSVWHEEDHEDDWRDPPIDVVKPCWNEGPPDKPSVTWLGHAGVMVQIPWKRAGKGRAGMCAVVFDPIFSYRRVICLAKSLNDQVGGLL